MFYIRENEVKSFFVIFEHFSSESICLQMKHDWILFKNEWSFSLTNAVMFELKLCYKLNVLRLSQTVSETNVVFLLNLFFD